MLTIIILILTLLLLAMWGKDATPANNGLGVWLALWCIPLTIKRGSNGVKLQADKA
jgi:hypothetical protein